MSEQSAGIAPWLSIGRAAEAVQFYKSAFGATEVYRLSDEGAGMLVRLSVSGAEFWVSDGDCPEPVGGGSVRMILTVTDPDALFAQAVAAGAIEVFPVSEGYGWRVGRIADPFGLHWEIGRPLA